MASGLGIIVVGVVTTLMNQLTSLQLPALAVNGAVFAIFMGALLWLTGAQMGAETRSVIVIICCVIMLTQRPPATDKEAANKGRRYCVLGVWLGRGRCQRDR